MNGLSRDELLARRRRFRLLGTGIALVAFLLYAVLASGSENGGGGAGGGKEDRPDVACDGEQPPAAEPQQYDEPATVLRDGVDYGAVITTSCGEIVLDLLEEQAQTNVNNFMFLASEGFYDGLAFYRVERNSVIATGDPNNEIFEEPDGPGYTITDELPGEPNDYVFGVVAMANEGRPDSAGSQFFIVTHENRPAGYQLAYSIFGVVGEESYEVLREISNLETRGGREPIEAVQPIAPVYVESIEITEN
ncbi:MAG: peptidylprolyl isomerase [Actinomycetota bacterium]